MRRLTSLLPASPARQPGASKRRLRPLNCWIREDKHIVIASKYSLHLWGEFAKSIGIHWRFR